VPPILTHMDDILKPETLNLFLFFVVPGFVSLKVYDLFIASERRNLSESAIEVVSFSMLNLAIWYWLIDLVHRADVRSTHPLRYYLAIFLVIFISPALLAVLTQRLLRSEFLRGKVIHPTGEPWDYVFSQGESMWVLFHLKNGKKVGGYYSANSFASSHPHPPSMYVEQLWRVDAEGKFVACADRTAGAIIRFDECELIEFFTK
jgi:hypothetical protein